MSLSKFATNVFLTNLGFFRPYEINFAITYRCNSRCKVCGTWKRKFSDELELKEIKKIVKNLHFVNWVRLTGGEPFLRKDFIDIVKLFSQIPQLYFLITPTNALLPNLIFERVKDVLKFFKKRYAVAVSLDGPERIHDKIRGVKGSWKKSIETYKKLKTLEEKYNNFKVYFGYTISPHNVGYFRKTLKEIKQFIPETKATDFNINLFHISDLFYLNADQKIPKKYFNEAVKELDTILKMRKKEKIFDPIFLIENKYLELGKKYLKTKKIPISCNIFNLSCFIDPMGNVYPCTNFNKKLGNLRDFDYDLKSILMSNLAKEVKNEIKKGRCPQCWTPCEAHQIIFSNWFK